MFIRDRLSSSKYADFGTRGECHPVEMGIKCLSTEELAAALWIIGATVWGAIVVPRIVRRQ